MNQIEIDHNEDQDIQELFAEISYSRQKRQILNKKRRRRRRNMRILSILSVAIIIGIIVLIITTLQSIKNTFVNESIPVEQEIESTSNPFEFIYYYESDRLERYIAYQKANPMMDIHDIIWRVNSNLDMPWYEYDVPVNDYEDPYIIVNKYNRVSDGYRPPDLTNVDGYQMRKETGKAYLEMKKAAAADGLRIRAVSAYRSVEYQKGLYERYLASDSKENVDRYSARAGYSEHHTGMAIDLFGSTDGLRNFKNTPEYPWVKENCYKFGFIIRYTTDIENITGYEDEPWHIRYVGKEVSTDMKGKGIASFEEYHAKYIEHSPSDK